MRLSAGCFAVLLLYACTRSDDTAALTSAQRETITLEIEQRMRDAYDFSKPDVTARMLSLYPDRGRVVSAAAGRVVTSRDSLAEGISYFWNSVGRNMRSPRWEWVDFYVDVLSPAAAVVTATYRIPHLNPSDEPHVIAGAMTEVFEKRGGTWVVVQEHLSDLPATEAPMPGMPDSMRTQ